MSRLARFSKGIAALVSSIVALLLVLGVELPPTFDAAGFEVALVGIVTALGVIFAPANAPPASDTGKPAPGDPERLPGA
jgi:hypothetical protein